MNAQGIEELGKGLVPLEFQTENLVLLIGTNPLPNLVAAKLLLKEDGTLYLVHSADTGAIALQLEKALMDRYGVHQCQKVEVDQASARDVRTKIESLMKTSRGSVGLHYTGGTKTMAVHTYRAIESGTPRTAPRPVFSYLDANSFELRVDPDWHEKVLFQVKPTLEDLLALHGILLDADRRTHDVVLSGTATELARAAPSGGLQVWRHWCDHVLRETARIGKDWRKKGELRKITLPLPDASTLQDAVAMLKSELGLPSDAVDLPLDPSRLRWPFPKDKPKYLCRWLDGAWLEYYVLSQIRAVAEQCQIHDWGMTLATDPESSLFEFEFDVAAMRGYQLFGISCTTDLSKTIAKFKLFEAYIRSRQLGGDEARVGLVGGWPDPEKLRREVAYSWDVEGKIMVFGPQQMPDLGAHLAQWLKTAS